MILFLLALVNLAVVGLFAALRDERLARFFDRGLLELFVWSIFITAAGSTRR